MARKPAARKPAGAVARTSGPADQEVAARARAASLAGRIMYGRARVRYVLEAAVAVSVQGKGGAAVPLAAWEASDITRDLVAGRSLSSRRLPFVGMAARALGVSAERLAEIARADILG